MEVSLDSIFVTLGGAAEVGRVIGVTTEHAGSMRRRGKIPVRYWPALLKGLQSKGIEVTEADFVRIYLSNKTNPAEAAS